MAERSESPDLKHRSALPSHPTARVKRDESHKQISMDTTVHYRPPIVEPKKWANRPFTDGPPLPWEFGVACTVPLGRVFWYHLAAGNTDGSANHYIDLKIKRGRMRL